MSLIGSRHFILVDSASSHSADATPLAAIPIVKA